MNASRSPDNRQVTRSPVGSEADGAVVVSVSVDRPTADAWPAITDKSRIQLWFGAASDSLTAGAPVRFDFGDGDFFQTGMPVVDQAGMTVEFGWRFLGVGPVSRVRWQVRPTAGGGSQLTVTDRGEDRDQAAADELTAGWTDFFGRLSEYLTTGRSTRYDSRGDIDGVIDVPSAGADLLTEPRLGSWLPVVTSGPDRYWLLTDRGERFPVSDWHDGAAELRFSVHIPGAARPTAATVRIRELADGVRVTFQQAGWHELGLAPDEERELRTRFTAAWIAALRKAAAGLAGAGAR